MANDNGSLSHTKWNWKYHIVFVPKYRRQVVYRQIKADIGRIIRQLCKMKKVEIIEAEACPDHIHRLVSIPPNISVSQFVGYLKFIDDIRQTCELEVQVWEPTFLVPRVLCRYGGTE